MSSLSPHLSRAPEWPAPARTRPMLALRLRVLLHRTRLDAMIVDGADTDADLELALRARQLTAMPYRHKLANGLDAVLSIAEGYHRRVSSAPPLARRDIRASRAALLQLSRALRHDPVVTAAGVVRARQLLTDGTGPLYVEADHDALWHALRDAVACLEGHD